MIWLLRPSGSDSSTRRSLGTVRKLQTVHEGFVRLPPHRKQGARVRSLRPLTRSLQHTTGLPRHQGLGWSPARAKPHLCQFARPLTTKNLCSILIGIDALSSNLQGRFCCYWQSGQNDLVGPEIALALDGEKSSQSSASTIDPTFHGAKYTATNLCGLFV